MLTCAIVDAIDQHSLKVRWHPQPFPLAPASTSDAGECRFTRVWLDPRLADAAALLKPFDVRLMRSYPVSARINHVANDDAECSARVDITEPHQAPLFW